MLIFSVFKTLTDQRVTVELKNDLSITGVLKSVDQFLNIRLDSIKVLDEARHPHMMAVKNCFIRGSVVRYVQLPAEHVDTQLLEDATRRGCQSSQTVNSLGRTRLRLLRGAMHFSDRVSFSKHPLWKNQICRKGEGWAVTLQIQLSLYTTAIYERY
ncbi:Sm-like ribonucleoprotein [Laetiporus sulphureus 93-53]|uniref:Sm-like ribonucleo protein n=1 Tax=Laetiporus sulphureus 93-53 TaxID=1314785 RepID=A0A165DD28_9APHY|nr:Sm-like ribonucleoprotein [Laetiporus sulphureus 93-53]KZT04602.1 Sm-like ribonucleo protein [Laetiporus sulphureus 93-53]